MSLHHSIGKQAEELAANYFTENGYTILHRNWRHSRYEIDIIASKKGTLHFIEVKALTTSDRIHPEKHVTRTKFRSLKKAAEEFLHHHPDYARIQFDVVSVTMKKDTGNEFFLIEDVYV